MAQEADELKEIGRRMKGLREACDVTAEEMAADLEVDLDRYLRWEETRAFRFRRFTTWRANSALSSPRS